MALDIVDLEKMLMDIFTNFLSKHLSILRESVEPGSDEPAANERAAGAQEVNHTRASEVKIVASFSQPACIRGIL